MNWYKKSITLKRPNLEDLFDDKPSVVQNLNQAFKKITLDISISLTQQQLPEFTVPRVSSFFASICEDIAIQAQKCGVEVIDFKPRTNIGFGRTEDGGVYIKSYSWKIGFDQGDNYDWFVEMIKNQNIYSDAILKRESSYDDGSMLHSLLYFSIG